MRHSVEAQLLLSQLDSPRWVSCFFLHLRFVRSVFVLSKLVMSE
jgi:hypothetical protein